MKLNRLMLGTVLATLTALSQASIVTIGIDGQLSAYDGVFDFESPVLAVDAGVSNQFAGVTFTPLAGGRVAYSSCGSGNLDGLGGSAHYIDNYGPSCAGNLVDDSFSMKFSTAYSAVSLVGDLRFETGMRIQTLLGGVQVEVQNFTGEVVGLLITGTTFDEIRFLEDNPDSQQLVQFDNVRFQNASAVPLPGTLALLGLGALGYCLPRRSEQKLAA